MANTFLDTSNRSIRDDFEQTPPSEYLSLKKFRDYSVEYAYPASGGEADLFRLEKDNQKYIGKLYRKGIVPNEEILKIINIAKNQVYIINDKKLYEQESLF